MIYFFTYTYGVLSVLYPYGITYIATFNYYCINEYIYSYDFKKKCLATYLFAV